MKALDPMCPAIPKRRFFMVSLQKIWRPSWPGNGSETGWCRASWSWSCAHFLDCGVLARGFLRVHCDACGLDRLVPYSCKKRSFCPSCGGRRMADTAAHLVDRVFPEVPVRQWVLSVPYALRYRLAYDSSLVRDVLQIFVRTIFASIRRRAGIPASNRQARCGAVAFIQRFSDALNLDPHFHVLALDGIYVIDGKGEPVFRHVSPPTDKEVARVAERVHRRVARLMEKRGLGPQADPDEADGLRRDEPMLAELYGASVSGRVATGPRAGMRIARVGDEVDPEDGALPSGPCCASVAGFSVHAGVCVPARDRMRLEDLQPDYTQAGTRKGGAQPGLCSRCIHGTAKT